MKAPKVVALCCVAATLESTGAFWVPTPKTRPVRSTHTVSLQAGKSPFDSFLDGFRGMTRGGGGGPMGNGGGGSPTRTIPGSKTVREVPNFLDPSDGREAPFMTDDRQYRRYNQSNRPPSTRGASSRRNNNNNKSFNSANRRGNNNNNNRNTVRTADRGVPGMNSPKPWEGFKNPFSINNNNDNNNNRKSSNTLARSRPTNNNNINNSNNNNNAAPVRANRGRPAPQRNVNLSEKARTIWDTVPSIRVQGTVQKTWSFTTGAINRVHVMMRTDGRPLSANVELWRGPDNSPQIMAVYIEDGCVRPFNAIIETPGSQNVISVRNTNSLEFPLNAILEAELDDIDIGLEEATKRLEYSPIPPRLVQGGSVYTKGFDYTVASVQIQLKTDGRPLCARIELLQGPNNSKQVMDVYTENGLDYPFFMVVETPGSENVFRVVNTATVEYPLTASLQAYEQTVPAQTIARDYSGINAETAFDVERIL